MPSSLHIPQGDIERLQHGVFRPGDTISGVVRAQGVGTLGGKGGYSFVEATLSVWIRLIKTTTEEYYYGGPSHSSFGREKEYYEEDDLEETVYLIGEETLFDLATDGACEAKLADLLFGFIVPEEAERQLLPPTMGDFVQYFISIRAIQQDMGEELIYFLENLHVLPADDGLGTVRKCPEFLMNAPYQPAPLSEQKVWEQVEDSFAVCCPSRHGRETLEQGTVTGTLYVPAFDLLSETSFPVVLELTCVAPASYDEREVDWESFRPPLILEEGAEWVCKIQSCMAMTLEKERGGDGETRERAVYDYERYFRRVDGHLRRKNIFPAWSSEGRSSGADKEPASFALPGYGWSAPVRDPSAGGVRVSQAWVKGSICLPPHVTPNFMPKGRDEFQVFNILWVRIPVPGAAKPLEFGLYKKVRNVSGRDEMESVVGGDDPPPKYKR